LAGGGAVTAGSVFSFPARLVTTAGPASGTACFFSWAAACSDGHR
jgi:hypothetical protein